MKDSYRVVYGETLPAWERSFPSKAQAEAFAKKQKSLGDIVFSVAKVIPGEPPQSATAALSRIDAIETELRARAFMMDTARRSLLELLPFVVNADDGMLRRANNIIGLLTEALAAIQAKAKGRPNG